MAYLLLALEEAWLIPWSCFFLAASLPSIALVGFLPLAHPSFLELSLGKVVFSCFSKLLGLELHLFPVSSLPYPG